jgi:hypothetical protein
VSGMNDALRDLLRRKADEMTSPHGDVPPALVRRARFRMARNSAAVAAVVLVLVAGAFTGYRAFAGSNAEGPAGNPTPPPTAHPTHTPASPPAHSPSPSPSQSPSGSPAAPRCTLGHLHVSEAGSNGAAGSIQVTIALRNIGSTTCTLEGYPGMALLSGGHVLHTDVVRGSSVVVPPIHVRLVTLAPGAVASYVFGYSDVPTNGQSCPSSDGLEVTPPNAFGHATISLQATACGGVLTTSPVFPGTHIPSS